MDAKQDVLDLFFKKKNRLLVTIDGEYEWTCQKYQITACEIIGRVTLQHFEVLSREACHCTAPDEGDYWRTLINVVQGHDLAFPPIQILYWGTRVLNNNLEITAGSPCGRKRGPPKLQRSNGLGKFSQDEYGSRTLPSVGSRNSAMLFWSWCIVVLSSAGTTV
jgi:hypothetical protein